MRMGNWFATLTVCAASVVTATHASAQATPAPSGPYICNVQTNAGEPYYLDGRKMYSPADDQSSGLGVTIRIRGGAYRIRDFDPPVLINLDDPDLDKGYIPYSGIMIPGGFIRNQKSEYGIDKIYGVQFVSEGMTANGEFNKTKNSIDIPVSRNRSGQLISLHCFEETID